MASRYKKLFWGIVVCVVALGGLLVSYVYFSDRFSENKNELTNSEKEAFLEQAEQEADAKSRSIEQTNRQMVESLTGVQSLQTLSEDQQGEIGIMKITDIHATGVYDEAYPYIDYLMLRDDTYGLDASTLCFIMKSDPTQKTQCRDRATEPARQLGVIQDGEDLSENFFIVKEGDE